MRIIYRIRPKSGILIGDDKMERNKLIIIGLAIVIVALGVGLAAMMQAPAKEDVKLTIKDKAIEEGGSVKIKLTDRNGNPIEGQTVNISVTYKKGTTDYHSVVTDENGVGKLKLDKSPGKYTVNCTYGGNDNYTANSTSQKLKINEVEEASSSTDYSSDSSSSQDYSSYESSSESYRPDVDSSGITREQADKFGYTYTNEHGGHYIGSNDHWDEKAGVYHD